MTLMISLEDMELPVDETTDDRQCVSCIETPLLPSTVPVLDSQEGRIIELS